MSHKQPTKICRVALKPVPAFVVANVHGISVLYAMSQPCNLDACLRALEATDTMAEILRSSFGVESVGDLCRLAQASLPELTAIAPGTVTPVQLLGIKQLLQSPAHVRDVSSTPASAESHVEPKIKPSWGARSIFSADPDVPPMAASMKWSPEDVITSSKFKAAFRKHMKDSNVPQTQN